MLVSYSPVSQNIGGLPVIGDIFAYGVVSAYIIMVVADIGGIYVLDWVEWYFGGLSPHERPWYKAALWADLLFLPIMMASATIIAQQIPPADGAWYTNQWLHLAVLVAALALSIFVVERWALKAGQYTMRQELSPSKAYHTVIFGVVGYWMVIAFVLMVVGLFLDLWTSLASLGIAIGFAGFVWSNSVDWDGLGKNAAAFTNAHMELVSLRPLRFQPRRGYYPLENRQRLR